MTVLWLAGYISCPDSAARTRPVLDDGGISELAELFADESSQHVNATPGRVGDGDFDFLTDDEGLSEKLVSIEPLVKAGALLRVNDEVFIADWFRYQNFQSDRSLRNLREDIGLIKSNRIRRIVEEKARVFTSSIKDAEKLQHEEEQGKKEQKDDVDRAQKGAEESGGARQRKEISGDSAVRQSRGASPDQGSLDRNELGILYDPGNLKDVELLKIIMTLS